MVAALVKCKWANRRNRHLCLNKLGNANYNNAATTRAADTNITAATAAAAKAIRAIPCSIVTFTSTAATATFTSFRCHISNCRAAASTTSIINSIAQFIKQDIRCSTNTTFARTISTRSIAANATCAAAAAAIFVGLAKTTIVPLAYRTITSSNTVSNSIARTTASTSTIVANRLRTTATTALSNEICAKGRRQTIFADGERHRIICRCTASAYDNSIGNFASSCVKDNVSINEAAGSATTTDTCSCGLACSTCTAAADYKDTRSTFYTLRNLKRASRCSIGELKDKMIVSIRRCRRAVGVKINDLGATCPRDLTSVDKLAHICVRKEGEHRRNAKHN